MFLLSSSLRFRFFFTLIFIDYVDETLYMYSLCSFFFQFCTICFSIQISKQFWGAGHKKKEKKVHGKKRFLFYFLGQMKIFFKVLWSREEGPKNEKKKQLNNKPYF